MSAPDRSKTPVNSVDAACLEWLKEKECLRDFETLVGQNCEPTKLWGYMSAVMIAGQHHAELASHRSDLGGFDKDTFAGFVMRARRVADELERLYSSDLGLKAIEQARGIGSLAEFRNIPRQLRLIVEQAQTIYDKTSHRRKPLYDEAVAELCVYVKQIAGEWHDKEVSGLVGALTGRVAYSEDDQRGWRHERRALLDRIARRMNESHESRR